MNTNNETGKSTGKTDKGLDEYWKKVIVSIILIFVAIGITYWMGFTPCKIAISLNPQVEFCQSETPPIIISVRSDVAWQDTKIYVQPGQILFIMASGSINTWDGHPIAYSPDPNGQTQNEPCPSTSNLPDCLINGELYGMLIGRIGENGIPFRIGSENRFSITTSGNLYLAINDDEPYIGDNSGEYNVSISIK